MPKNENKNRQGTTDDQSRTRSNFSLGRMVLLSTIWFAIRSVDHIPVTANVEKEMLDYNQYLRVSIFMLGGVCLLREFLKPVAKKNAYDSEHNNNLDEKPRRCR